MNKDDKHRFAKEMWERRKLIMDEWMAKYPEGITKENIKELRVFIKKREKEMGEA